ncbi:phenylacetate--CoA ligase family protein [Chloroflexota bacterium]
MKRKKVQEWVNSLPYPVRQIIKYASAALPPRLVHGRVFLETCRFLRDSQWWSRERLAEYQVGRLRDLLRHAYENVPYYRRVFDERGLRPEDIQDVDDLKKLPYLTKEIIRENYHDLRARNISRTIKTHTSGSSGEPFVFEEPSHADQVERAFIVRAFGAHNSRLFFEKSAWLRSYVPKSNAPLHRHDPHLRILYLSAYNLSPETLPEYVRLIDSYGAKLLVGYPSSLYVFSMLLEGSGMHLDHLEVAHTGSEELPAPWRERIETVLNIPVKDHYGMSEKVALFHQCCESNLYHENLEYAVVEVVDMEDSVGEVVGTSLWNYAMPLIRYRMADLAKVHTGEQVCSCGRGLPLTMVGFEGRSDDIIITPERRFIPPVNFYTLMHRMEKVKMFQIIQHSVDRIEVKIVPSDDLDEHSMALLERGLRERLGRDICIDICQVRQIERNRDTGKMRCIESRVRGI